MSAFEGSLRLCIVPADETVSGNECTLEAFSEHQLLLVRRLKLGEVFELPKGTDSVSVSECPGHWEHSFSTADLVKSTSAGGVITLELGRADLSWWKDLIGIPPGQRLNGGGLRLGVVDTAFHAPHWWRPTNKVSTRFRGKREKYLMPANPNSSHGFMVVSLIREIMENIEVVFYDATSDDDQDFVDVFRVKEGILDLSLNCQVDIINISCGFRQRDRLLAQAIEKARAAGTICIAAGGNGLECPVHFPASLDSTVGVGGVGRVGLGPPSSLVGQVEGVARGLGLVGTPDGQIFADPFTALGPGINALGPSVGLGFSSYGGLTDEFSGSSCAAPLVCCVLASALGADPSFQTMLKKANKGLDKANHAMGTLSRLCHKLGLPSDYVGWGVAVVPQ